jgi:hypothetical protein
VGQSNVRVVDLRENNHRLMLYSDEKISLKKLVFSARLDGCYKDVKV